MQRSAAPAAAPEGFVPGATVTRASTLSPGTYDAKTRTVEAVLSVGARVRRYGMLEELSMDPASVDLGRAVAGQVKLLDSHNAYQIDAVLGSVENIRFENGKLVGLLRFADSDAGRKAEKLVADGMLTGISIGYRVSKWVLGQVENNTEIWRADAWELLEVSLVAVPADPQASVRAAAPGLTAHSQENDVTRAVPSPAGTEPAERTDPAVPPAPTVTPATPPVPGQTRAVEPPAPATGNAPVAMSATSALQLARMADAFGLRADAEAMIDQGLGADAIRSAIMDKAAERQRANATIGGPRTEVTRDEGDTRRRAIELAVLHRVAPGTVQLSGPKADEGADQAREFRGMSLIEMGRSYHEEATGVRLRGLGRMETAGVLLGLTRAGMHSTSDFPTLLGNVIAKRLRDNYRAAVQTWKPLARQSNAPDFKERAVVALSGMPEFKKVREGQEYEYATLGEGAEKYAIATFGRIVAFTRQMLINDDLGAFDRLPTLFGRAAAKLESDVVWGVIIDNAAMGDGKALFHADHKNLAGTGAAISEATVEAAEIAMGEQVDAGGEPMNLRPRFLVVPPKHKVAAQKLLTAVTAGKSGDVNVYSNAMELIVEQRLKPAAGAAPWFMAADPAEIDTIEYAYLDGEEGLYTEERVGFDVDGIEVKGRLDFGAKAIDHRGFYKNPGV